MSTAELAVSYAALILADDGIEITVRAPVPVIEFKLVEDGYSNLRNGVSALRRTRIALEDHDCRTSVHHRATTKFWSTETN